MVMSRETFESMLSDTSMYNFGYSVEEKGGTGQPTGPAVRFLSFGFMDSMTGFNSSYEPRPGIKLDATDVWLDTEQVDELIVALTYWRETHGNRTV